MSCIFSNVSGHSVKSVSTAQEQVLPRPNSVGGVQGGSVATPQSDRQGEAIIPWTKEFVDEVLSIPETQSDRLSFPNLQGTTEEEEKEEEEEEGEEVEEDKDDNGNDAQESQDEGDDGDEGEEDGRKEDAELEQEGQEHPPLEGGAISE